MNKPANNAHGIVPDIPITPYRKCLAERHKVIIDRYQQVVKSCPNIAKTRIVQFVAEEFGMTYQGMLHLLIAKQVYDKKGGPPRAKPCVRRNRK